MLELVTAGESHGPGILCVLSGFPAGFGIDFDAVRAELLRRQDCAGRGARKDIEPNKLEILSGIRKGKTIGSPITVLVRNADTTIDEKMPTSVPRPGHAEMPGMIRYRTLDAVDIAERASARETAGRVAGGAICSQMLSQIGVHVMGCTLAIGGEWAEPFDIIEKPDQVISLKAMRESNPYHAVQPSPEWARILKAAESVGETLGGIFGVIAAGQPAGLGSHAQWSGKLDARIARALVSIQAVKSVEFGSAAAAAEMQGSDYHGGLAPGSKGIPVPGKQNHGGFAGGMTDGSPVIVRCAVKPVPTLSAPMKSVDLATGKKAVRPTERHDTCAVPAASVVGESVVAFELLGALIERFGASSFDELKKRMSEI